MTGTTKPALEPPDRIQSVMRAHAVLTVLAESARPLSTAETADRVMLKRGTVHRILRTLQDADLVNEQPAGRFAIGPTAMLLGHAYVDQLQVRRIALPYIADLSNRFVKDRPWVVALGVPLRSQAMLAERIWHSSAPLSNLLDVGTRMPFDASVNGRTMLATFTREDAVQRVGVERFEAVRSRLERVRNNGFCDFSSDEMRVGMSAAAVAVLGPDDRAVASIAISGGDLVPELHADSQVSAQLRTTAGAVSSLLTRQVV